MKLYNVYERRGTGRKFIASVFAETREEATDKAHEQYGAPIIVEEA